MADNDLLPDGAGDVMDEESQGELYVDFTSEEAESEGRTYELLPRGTYHVCITDGKIAFVTNSTKGHNGKPYWNLTLTVQSGPYESRKLFTNVMLFAGAGYSLSQLLKSLGYNVTPGQMKIPPLPELIGRPFNVFVVTQGKKVVNGQEYDARNEVKSFMPYDPAAAAKTAGGVKVTTGSSLMP